jgi:hypothetical protein
MSNNIPTNYVLIDYENVQPKNLEVLEQHPFEILVFVGSNQTKVSMDLALEMQKLGPRARYIQISGNGPNALDFHIAFYIGQLSERDPNCYFHIISKDTGFDPLIRHLKLKKLKVMRETDLAEIPLLRIQNNTDTDDQILAIVKNLVGRGQSRPRRVKTLSNTINTLFSEKLNNQEMEAVLRSLEDKKYIVIKDENVSYKLPSKN